MVSLQFFLFMLGSPRNLYCAITANSTIVVGIKDARMRTSCLIKNCFRPTGLKKSAKTFIENAGKE